MNTSLLFGLLTWLMWDVNPGITFLDLSVEEAVSLAREEGKMVFVDTYASWCAPCKKLDPVFADQEVASFYNLHFINIKVDMEGSLGEEMLYKYEVVKVY